jgi:hypothetical protein
MTILCIFIACPGLQVNMIRLSLFHMIWPCTDAHLFFCFYLNCLKNRVKYIFTSNVSPFFQFCLQSKKKKKITMSPNQVLTIFNVAHMLFQSIIFYENKTTCDEGFLRKILSKISLKKI